MLPRFEEDDTQIVEGRARFGRSYVRLALPVVLTVGVLLAGFLGTRSGAPAIPAPAPSGLPSEAVAQATATPNELFFGRGLPTAAPDPLLPGFLTYAAADTAAHVDLPYDITNPVLSDTTRRLYYVVGGTQIQSVDIAPDATPQTLITVPNCRAIDELAVAGDSILFVVIAPIGLPLHDTDCGNSSRFSWTIWRHSASGADIPLASGAQDTPPSWDTSTLVHIAVTPTEFAFERESIGQVGAGATVEVHSLDGALLWTTETDAPVRSLMLANDRLAVVTREATPQLELASRSDQTMARIAAPASGAYLSSDGSYLVWDTPDPADPSRALVTARALDQGGLTLPVASTPRGTPLRSPRPVAGSAGHALEVAWFATLSDGHVAPAFVDATHPSGALLETPQLPAWLGFIGDDLAWLVFKPDGSGSVAYVLDLASTS